MPAMKGTGALTEREGDKLQSSFQSLSTRLSEKQFDANLKEAKRLLEKGRKNLNDKYGMPNDKPDTPENRPSGQSYMVHAGGAQ